MIISERESKLLIDQQNGSRIIGELKIVNEAGPFSLGKCAPNEAQDAYFDSAGFDLARASSYLRIRGRRDGHYITLRYEDATKDELVVDEVTHPLDDKGLSIVISSLADRIKLPGSPLLTLPHFPEILQSVGLNEVLRVKIERVEREIFLEDVKIGKMKIDTFQYLRPQSIGPFFEVEVDSYKKALHKSASEFFSALATRFEKVSSPSAVSKYVRGISIGYGLTF